MELNKQEQHCIQEPEQGCCWLMLCKANFLYSHVMFANEQPFPAPKRMVLFKFTRHYSCWFSIISLSHNVVATNAFHTHELTYIISRTNQRLHSRCSCYHQFLYFYQLINSFHQSSSIIISYNFACILTISLKKNSLPEINEGEPQDILPLKRHAW